MTSARREVLLPVAGGAALSLLLAGGWPLWAPADDSLRGLIALLPTIGAALFAVLRHLGRPTAPLKALAPWAAAWMVAAVARHAVIGEDASTLFAGGFFVLLAVAFARTVRWLRPLLGNRLETRPSPLFFLLPLLAYSAILPWSVERPPDGDEPYYLLLTHSLAHDFDTDLTNNYQHGDARNFLERPLEPQMGDPRGSSGEILSRHNALLPLVLVPFYRLAGRPGAAFAMAVMAAALAWWLLRAARFWLADKPRQAFLAWVIFAFGPPLLFYSHQIWIEVPAALLWVVAWERCLTLTADAGSPIAKTRWPNLLGLALPLALLPLLKFRLLLVALPLALLALYRLRLGHRGRYVPLLFFAGSVAALLLYNFFYFGNPLKMYGRGDFELLFSAPALFLRGFGGIFYDVAFGLFAAAPLWALLPVAAWNVLREQRPFAAQAAWLVLPYTLGFTPRLEWFGGWAPPFRYPMVFLPLLAIALAFALDLQRPLLRAAFTALGAATVLLTLLWVTVPGWTYHLADGGNHLLGLLGDRLDGDLARFFPSFVRPRTATWLVLFLSLASAPLLAAGGPRGLRWRRLAAPVGLAALGVAVAVLPWLAHQLPSRRVELEDSWVRKRGGTLYPDRWAISRPTFPGGWTLPAGDLAEADVVPGGESLSFAVAARNFDREPQQLEIAAGDLVLALWTVPPGEHFQERRFGPVPWPAGQPLRLRTLGSGLITVDYVALDWH